MDEEEEKKYYGQGLRSDLIGAVEDYTVDSTEGFEQLFRDPGTATQTVLGTGLTSGLLGNIKPGVIGSAVEKQMLNKGTATLANPAYRKLLGQGIMRQGAQVAGIPVTAAVIAGDTVLAKSAEAQAEMDKIDAYQKSLEQQGIERAQDQAMTMRKYNIIEEQRAAREGRLPYGYDPDFPEEGANINVTNFRDYLAQVPADYRGPEELDFSSIDLSGQSQFPYYKDQSLNTGIDFSKFEQKAQDQPNLSALNQGSGEKNYVEMARNMLYPNQDLLSSDNPDFKPEVTEVTTGNNTNQVPSVITSYLGQLKEAGKSDDYRTDVAARYLRDYQGRVNNEVSPKRGTTETSSDFNQATQFTPPNELTMSDYRAILREKGIGGSAQIALAKQMMNEAAQGRYQGQLESASMIQDIINARKPDKPRARTASEFQMDVVNQLSQLQMKIDAGIELNPEEQMKYKSLNNLLAVQSGDPLTYESPFQMPSPNQKPSADSAEGEKIIEQVMAGNPGRTREEVIEALRESGKLS